MSASALAAQKALREPLYCFCKNVSYGDMIACDNKECPYEWFHFACVGLIQKPEGGKWFCQKCVAIQSKASPRPSLVVPPKRGLITLQPISNKPLKRPRLQLKPAGPMPTRQRVAKKAISKR